MKLIQVAIAIDQLANTIFGGYADETISARCYREIAIGSNTRFWRFMFHLVNIIMLSSNHCKSAYDSLIARDNLPPSYRQVKEV